MRKVLILGGYGNFGSRISYALVKANIPIIIAGRNLDKAIALKESIKKLYPNGSVETAIFDIRQSFSAQLVTIRPYVVIDTCGPFQTSDYSIAKTCMFHQVHYLDLADARDFVVGISSLDQEARKKDVLVVSGASTVPGLSSAVIEHYLKKFVEIESVIYGISPGQKAPRGLATTQSILTYLGKPLKPVVGLHKKLYGWQDLYVQSYPELGNRWMANCDVPDLDIFPVQYHIKSIRFSAGMENRLLHFGMWLVSWLVRLGLPLNLLKHAELLLRFSHFFDYFGSSDGGMHMVIKGKDAEGKSKTVSWFIIAKQGDGPQIPCVPAILLAKKLIQSEIKTRGAFPCVGFISLEEYMAALKHFSIYSIER